MKCARDTQPLSGREGTTGSVHRHAKTTRDDTTSLTSHRHLEVSNPPPSSLLVLGWWSEHPLNIRFEVGATPKWAGGGSEHFVRSRVVPQR
jgi:hypothetical protein